ncbi:MAG: tRNA (guanosine(37)-N1)-methyltransferase TrmD [Dethiobacter sp.]|nr:tRNA (guanosine(37)-N1)-methyltransferase TrmD [Dethiobacter sp.]
MRIDILTIFPRILQGPFSESMIKRALERGLAEINVVDLRLFAEGKHRQVDDAPYGGGCGMIFKPEPLFAAVEHLKSGAAARVILLSPQGRTFNQKMAGDLAGERHLILICGRYEGVDERVREALVDDEISIGDYILTGGELAAAVITDAVVRLIPGLLPARSVEDESFSASMLEYPQYTRPPEFRGLAVPAVLLSGNHAEIELWRRRRSIERTLKTRPDLLKNAELSAENYKYLEQLSRDQKDTLDSRGDKE